MNNYEMFNKKIFEVIKVILANNSDQSKIQLYYKFLNNAAFNVNVDTNSDKDTHDVEVKD